MHSPQVDLAAIARQEMIARGFEPDIPAAARQQAEVASQSADGDLADLTALLWSSIDNPESRDLDQVEYVERLPNGDLKVMVGIADVDALVLVTEWQEYRELNWEALVGRMRTPLVLDGRHALDRARSEERRVGKEC